MGSRFFEGPHIPKKGHQKAPGRPKPKSDQFCVSATHIHIGKALFSRAPNPEKKAPKRLMVAPSQKSGQSYQQLTYWEAAFVEGTNSRKKASKRPLVAPSQKVSSFISKSHIGKPYFEGPQFPKKGLKKAPWSPQRGEAQKGPERPREAQRGPERPSVDRTSLQKASKRPLVAPSQKVSSFISNSHIWEAALLKGPNSREKASKRTPGRPRHKSAQF